MCVCVCLVATLVWLSAVPPLSASLYINTCMCVCCVNKSVHVFVWVFHPWRDEKPRTICYAAVATTDSTVAEFNNMKLPNGWRPFGGSFGPVAWLVSRQIDSMPEEKSFCTPASHWLSGLLLCLTTVLRSAIGQLSHVSLFDQSRAFLEYKTLHYMQIQKSGNLLKYAQACIVSKP